MYEVIFEGEDDEWRFMEFVVGLKWIDLFVFGIMNNFMGSSDGNGWIIFILLI